MVNFLAASLTIYLRTSQRMELPKVDILTNTSGNRVGNVFLQLKVLRCLSACFIITAHEDAPMVKKIPTEYQLIRCSRKYTLPMRLISFPMYSTYNGKRLWEFILRSSLHPSSILALRYRSINIQGRTINATSHYPNPSVDYSLKSSKNLVLTHHCYETQMARLSLNALMICLITVVIIDSALKLPKAYLKLDRPSRVFL